MPQLLYSELFKVKVLVDAVLLSSPLSLQSDISDGYLASSVGQSWSRFNEHGYKLY